MMCVNICENMDFSFVFPSLSPWNCCFLFFFHQDVFPRNPGVVSWKKRGQLQPEEKQSLLIIIQKWFHDFNDTLW